MFLIEIHVIIMQKNIRFVEVIIFGFVFNVFQVKFIKGLYINDKFLGNEIENRKLFKVKSFCFDFSFLLYGYAINTLMLIYFLFRNKLSFFLFDAVNNKLYAFSSPTSREKKKNFQMLFT